MGTLPKIFKVAHGLSALSRYSQTHLIKEESVLEHTGFVCLVAYYIGIKLTEEGHEINFGELLCKAVVHDIDEIITGDIPQPTKYHSDLFRMAVQEIEEENMANISNDLEIKQMYENWLFAKDGKEGCIISICDWLAVLYKIWYESVMFGNKTLDSHVLNLSSFKERNNNNINNYFNGSKFLQSVFDDSIIMCNEIKTGGNK